MATASHPEENIPPGIQEAIEWLVKRYGNRLSASRDGLIVLNHPNGDIKFDVREIVNENGQWSILIPASEFQKRIVIPRLYFVVNRLGDEMPQLVAPEQMIARGPVLDGDILHVPVLDVWLPDGSESGPTQVAFPTTLPEAQLALDGREIRTDKIVRQRQLGIAQEEVLRYVRGFAPTANEMGTHLHLLADTGMCGNYARDHKYQKPYKGEGCCREASTRGSVVLKSLERGGAVWRDRNKRWHVRREDW